MKRLRANIDKFSFGQLTSNSDGKTSGSGTAGLYIVAVGGLCFLIGSVKIFFGGTGDVLSQSIILVGIGTALLGYRKSKDAKIVDIEVDEVKDSVVDNVTTDVNPQITDSVTSVITPIEDQSSDDPKNYDQINS